MSGFGTPRQRNPRGNGRRNPQASAAPGEPTIVVGGDDDEKVRMGFKERTKGIVGALFSNGNTVAITKVGPWKAAMGAFIGTFILSLMLNLVTAMSTPVCVASSVAADHTCSTPYSSDANLADQANFPDFGLQNVAIPAAVFFVFLFAEASSNAIGLGDYDAVTALERLVIAIFTDGQAAVPVTRLFGFLASLVASGCAALSTWALLGNNAAYNTSTSALGTGLGGPELTYIANIQGESYLVALVIILTAIKVAVEHTVKLNSHVLTEVVTEDKYGYKRTFNTLYSSTVYSVFIAGINAAFTAVTVYLWGTAVLLWTRDLANMLTSQPPVGDQEGDTVTSYNRYIFFTVYTAVGHVIGLIMFLAWNKLRNAWDDNEERIADLKRLAEADE